VPLKSTEIAGLLTGPNAKVADGRSLYLVIRNHRGYWVHQYRDGSRLSRNGKPSFRQTCLGTAADLSPNAARAAREAFSVKRRESGAPVQRQPLSAAPKPSARGTSASAPAGTMTVAQAVTAFLAVYAPSWKGGMQGSEAEAYERSLQRGDFGLLPIATLDTPDIVKHLATMPAASAEKARTRLHKFINWAVFTKHRPPGDNPARKKGHFEFAVPDTPKAKPHPAMKWSDAPSFVAEVLPINTDISRALIFRIATCCRRGDVLNATWSQIDVDNAVWFIPDSKEGDHHVALSPALLKLLGAPGKPSDPLFPGANNTPNMMNVLLREHVGERRSADGRIPDSHGFRTTFCDWAMRHKYPKEFRDFALDHAAGDATYQAYNRTEGDFYEELRPMLTAWSTFLGLG
jgi:integrase